jgi:iron complex outermembrane receptor protein
MTDRWNSYVSLAMTSREPVLRNLYAAEDAYFGATPQFAADTSSGMVRYDFGRPYARPEQLFDLETGVVYRSGTSRVAADLFWMEFRDELIENGQLDIFGEPVTGNAERTRHLGLEVEGSAPIWESFRVEANASITHNRLIRYSAFENGSRIFYDGNTIAGFPDFMGNLRFTYAQNNFFISSLAKYVGRFYTDNTSSDARRNDPYAFLDLEGSFQLPETAGIGITIRGEIHNVFNSLFFLGGHGNEFFPAAERNFLLGIRARI